MLIKALLLKSRDLSILKVKDVVPSTIPRIERRRNFYSVKEAIRFGVV